jgi:hypothetical protein
LILAAPAPWLIVTVFASDSLRNMVSSPNLVKQVFKLDAVGGSSGIEFMDGDFGSITKLMFYR